MDLDQIKEKQNFLLNFEDRNFKALLHLVHMEKIEAEQIAQYAIENPLQIQLVDFVKQIGLPQSKIDYIHQKQNYLVPHERQLYFEKYKQAVKIIPSLQSTLSIERMNPFTEFENQPPLLFGMGGGSKALCKGFPMDVLSMVLTAEKLRRELNLGRCKVICANGITYTNIPKNSDFTKERIDTVLSAERDLLQLVVERFGIADHWDIFLETDIETIIGSDLKDQYDKMITDADNVSFIGGHHYSIEMAQMWSLLNQKSGGVKLGWFINNLNVSQPKYIMDEQPFDARYIMYLASRGFTNKISIPYVKAGVRLFPGKTEQFDKDAPYICYNPIDRILLSPFENPVRKLHEATKCGGGLRSKNIRRHFGTIIKLFEEIVFEKNMLPVNHLNYKSSDSFKLKRKQIDDDLLEDDERFEAKDKNRHSKVASRLQYILDYIFAENRIEAEKIYKQAFPQGTGI